MAASEEQPPPPPVTEEEDDEHDTKERVLQKYFLQEWKLVKSLLDDIVSSGRVTDPSSVHKIRSILDKYQQQGELLEPYLESIVSPLMFIIRTKTTELGVVSDEILEVIKPLCIVVYTLVTVCGYKSVIRFFPHQVSDLELAVSLLEKCHGTASGTSLRQESTGEMEAKCVVLLWLSILVLVPFDISSVDSTIVDGDGGGGNKNQLAPLVMRILEFSKDYLSSAGPMRTIAGLVLSRLLARPDMPLAFSSFVEWTHEVLSSGKDDTLSHFRLLGAVEALAAIFKSGRREALMDVVPVVWGDVLLLSKSGSAARSPLLRKHLVKLAQRIGFTCLPHRLPTWCYVGRTSSFGGNVSQCEPKGVADGSHKTVWVVRWSAAKGIGRITSRLTSALADEALSSVLELFSPGEALHYDIRRGPHSVGSHVRDAAAYVCWAFGRAYYHTDMRNVLEQLGQHLLTVACYDREDKSLRELAAEALSALVKYDPQYFMNHVIETLIPSTLSSDLCKRHGVMLAIGEVILALHQHGCAFDSDMQKRVSGIVPAIEKARLYRGKGGEIMRSAVSRFIECISLSHLAVPEKIKRSLLDTLNENLRHPNSQIQNAAVRALKEFVPSYLDNVKNRAEGGITAKYLEQLADQNDNPEDRDAEARVNAVKALVSVCKTLTQSRNGSHTCSGDSDLSLYHLIKNEVMACLFKALDDYSVDNRGDVGSWVREAAIEGLESCTYLLCTMDSTRKSYGTESGSEISNSDVAENNQPLFFDENLAITLIGGIAKQAVEKMDRIREAAAKVLQRILYNKEIFVPFIAHREKLEDIVPNVADLKWGVPAFSYPRFVELLQFSCYSKPVLSVGTEGAYKGMSRTSMLGTDILWVLLQYRKSDRVVVPTLKLPMFCAGVLDSLAVELKGSKDFTKLYAGIAILGYIASVSDPVNARAFSHLLFLLAHRYPKIRKASAEQVYLVLLQNGDLVPEDKLDKALEIISETCWDGDIEAAKDRRLELFEIAGLETAMVKTADKVSNRNDTKGPTTNDENSSYSALVGSSGF
ncbi:hypothetical protein Tsubulata_925447 [Turnera subulata]|uniref:Tubulin-specific chaperone D n=1 Tax=Turnera subulata TaxID=218843 RepID=A0A9Q0FGJ6_9ROSI|nr:hypothetical protein Tsubulata_925447 [Turnera subulata]